MLGLHAAQPTVLVLVMKADRGTSVEQMGYSTILCTFCSTQNVMHFNLTTGEFL
jgi:hypothetical protein